MCHDGLQKKEFCTIFVWHSNPVNVGVEQFLTGLLRWILKWAVVMHSVGSGLITVFCAWFLEEPKKRETSISVTNFSFCMNFSGRIDLVTLVICYIFLLLYLYSCLSTIGEKILYFNIGISLNVAPESRGAGDHQERSGPSLPKSSEGLWSWGPCCCSQQSKRSVHKYTR